MRETNTAITASNPSGAGAGRIGAGLWVLVNIIGRCALISLTLIFVIYEVQILAFSVPRELFASCVDGLSVLQACHREFYYQLLQLLECKRMKLAAVCVVARDDVLFYQPEDFQQHAAEVSCTNNQPPSWLLLLLLWTLLQGRTFATERGDAVSIALCLNRLISPCAFVCYRSKKRMLVFRKCDEHRRNHHPVWTSQVLRERLTLVSSVRVTDIPGRLTRPKIMSQLPDGPANSQHQTASSRQKCNPAPSQLSLSGFSSTRPLRRTRESENVFLIVYGRTSHPP
ncbi:hypothetical protein F2P81_011190 [Scophthalmus maximus]|uniref:Uncharacterized protein n=1 Tax=Scophthalmus maximus TaxID=52904 RepID=A0A6A4SUS4_SCOMX|nr:hypothetical protein F2P81_011190 [Scophthalmus maximus]